MLWSITQEVEGVALEITPCGKFRATKLNMQMYSRGRKREHSKVCIRQVTLSVGNPITAGFIGCRVPNFSSLSCIEISHFSKRCAGWCDKN